MTAHLRIHRRSRSVLDAPAALLFITLCFVPAASPGQDVFIRGNSNGDSRLDIADPVFTLLYLYLGGREPPCLDAADADDNEDLDITDPIVILQFLFLAGSEPPAPGRDRPGPDPEDLLHPEALDCKEPQGPGFAIEVALGDAVNPRLVTGLEVVVDGPPGGPALPLGAGGGGGSSFPSRAAARSVDGDPDPEYVLGIQGNPFSSSSSFRAFLASTDLPPSPASLRVNLLSDRGAISSALATRLPSGSPIVFPPTDRVSLDLVLAACIPGETCRADSNSPPIAVPIPPAMIKAGAALTLVLDARDPDGDPLSFEMSGLEALPGSPSFEAAARTFTWRPPASAVREAPYQLAFRASDGRGGEAEGTVAILVTAEDSAPVFTPVGPRFAVEGMSLVVPLEAADPDGDPVAISADLSGLPPSARAAFDGSARRFTWTPGFGDQRPTPYRIRFEARDPAGAATPLDLEVWVTDVDRPPLIIGPDELTVHAGREVQVRFTVSDPEGDPVDVSADLSGLPPGSGASFDPAEGTLRWTPGLADARPEPWSFLITAVDHHGGVPGTPEGKLVRLTVNRTNSPPSFAPPPILSAGEGEGLAQDLDVSDPEGQEVTLSLDASLLPPGNDAALEGMTFRWTPRPGDARDDLYRVALTARDDTSLSSRLDVYIAVHPTSSIEVRRVELIDADRNGSFDRARLELSAAFDPVALPPADVFTLRLEPQGAAAVTAAGGGIESDPDARALVITFGTGIPTTGLDGVSFEIESGAVLTPAGGGAPVRLGPRSITALDVASDGGRVLVDKAPPVLIATSSQDADGNGGVDRLELVFSEPIQFSAGRAAAIGNIIDHPDQVPIPAGATLLVSVDGAPPVTFHVSRPTTAAEAEVLLRETFDAVAPELALEVTFTGAGGEFGRYVIRSGSTGAGSSLHIAGGSAAAPLGFDGSHLEVPASGGDVPDLDDFIVLTAGGRLLDLAAGDFQVSGNSLSIAIREPDIPPGDLSFFFTDDFSESFIADAAGNDAAAITDFPGGVAAGASGFIRIRDTDSAPDDGVLSVAPGVVALDLAASVIPAAWVRSVRLDAVSFTGGAPLTFLLPARREVLAPAADVFPGLTLADAVEVVALAASGADPHRLRLTVALDGTQPRGLAVDSSGRITRTFTLQVDDLPPVADAGRQLFATRVGAAVTLDGSQSQDPNGGEVAAFQWTVIAPSGQTTALGGASPTLVPAELGAYRLSLVVTDATGHPSLPSRSVMLATGTDPSDLLPTADAGVDRVARVNQPVVLDGSASRDPSGRGLRYEWAVVDEDDLVLQEAVFPLDEEHPGFTPPAPGMTRFRLSVTDAAGGRRSAPDFVRVIAIDPPAGRQVPWVDLSGPASASVFERVTLHGEPRSRRLSTAEYRWRQVGGPTVALSEDRDLLGLKAAIPGTYVFELVVVDSTGLRSAPARTRVAVLPEGATAPVVDAGPDVLDASGAVTLQGQVSGVDPVLGARFLWSQVRGVPVVLSSASTLSPTFTPPASGVYVFELVVAEGRTTFSDRVMVAVSLPGDPLPVARLDLSTEADGLVLDGSSSTPAGVRFSFEQTAGLPSILTALDADASQVRFTPDLPGVYTFELTVVDTSRRLRSAPAVSGILDAGIASSLLVSQGPSPVAAGDAMAPSVQVTVTDAFGGAVAVPPTRITVALGANPAGATLLGTTEAMTSGGVAAFPDLRIERAGTGLTLVFSSAGLRSAETVPFAVSAAAPSSLAMVEEPVDAVAGERLSTVRVRAVDRFGNASPAALTVTAALAPNSTGAVLAGTTEVTAAGGEASFLDLQVDRAGQGYRLVFSSPGLAEVLSVPFDVDPAPDVTLAVTVEPGPATAGATLSPAPRVQFVDRFGNPVSSSAAVTASLAPNSAGAVLAGTTAVNASGGTATFADLRIERAGEFVIVFQSPGAGSAETGTVSVSPASPDHLVFGQGPGDVAAGAAMAPAVQVQVRDRFGNASPAALTVTAALGVNPTGAVLLGTTEAAASGGTAAFSDLRIERAASGYTLRFTSPGLSPLESASFEVRPGPAQALAFRVQPSAVHVRVAVEPVVEVGVVDRFGNLSPSPAATVSMAIDLSSGPGVLSGTTEVLTVAGVASFPGLSIDRAGSAYRLIAASPGLTEVASVEFTVGNDPPSVANVTIGDPGIVPSGCVAIGYTLFDTEGDPVDVVIQFARAGAPDFAPVTQAGADASLGSHGTEGLATSPSGVPHSFTWNTTADLGSRDVSGVVLRITPRDADGAGAAAISDAVAVVNGLHLEARPPLDSTAPVSIVAADVDRDGRPDLVSVNAGSGPVIGAVTVSLQSSSAPGTFLPGVSSFAGPDPQAIAAGDIYRDGKVSLAVASSASDQVIVGREPVAIALADLNGDGSVDVVTADRVSGKVSVVLQGSSGGFLPAADFPAGAEPSAIAIGDFDRDGRPDLAVACRGADQVAVLLQDPLAPGSFLPASLHAVGSVPSAIAAADLDGDGLLDIAVACASSGSVSVLPGAPGGGFLPQRSFPAGLEPVSVAIGDLDGDGLPDLAVADGTGQTLAAMLQDPASPGTFATTLVHPLGAKPSSLAVADLNRDGRPDFALAVQVSNQLLVLEDRQPPACELRIAVARSAAAGAAPVALAVADFDGDGRLDLAVANDAEPIVSVLAGRGNGSLTVKGDLTVGSASRAVVSGDLDGDGRPDLAVAGLDSEVSVLFADPAVPGGFRSGPVFAVAGGPRALAVGDVNRDGDLDLLVASDGPGLVSTLLGRGDGTFAAAAAFPTAGSPTALAVADMNRDGRPDLVCVTRSPDQAVVLLGNGDGSFRAERPPFAAAGQPSSVVVGDLNGDGRPDLAVSNRGSGDVSVLLGDGTGGFAAAAGSPFLAGAAPSALASGDVDGDGVMDLVVANADSHDLTVLRGRGDGQFDLLRSVRTGERPVALLLADLDGDGRPDVAVANQDGRSIWTFRNSARGLLAAAPDLGSGFEAVPMAVADLDRDGKVDLVRGNPASSPAAGVSVFRGIGSGRYLLVSGAPADARPVGIGVGDFNRDGILDLALACGPGGVAIRLGDGAAGFHSVLNPPAGPEPSAVAAADLDGDGLLDLAVTDGTAGSVTLLQGDGAGSFLPLASFAAGARPVSVAIGDLDRNGHPDIVVANRDSHDVAVVLAFPGGVFAPSAPTPVGIQPVCIAIGDFDRDGILDICVADRGSRQVTVFRGDGTGGFVPAAGASTIQEPSSIAVMDADDDGVQDVVVTTTSGELLVFLGEGDGGLSEPEPHGTPVVVLGSQSGSTLSSGSTVKPSSGGCAVGRFAHLGGVGVQRVATLVVVLFPLAALWLLRMRERRRSVLRR